MYVLNKKKSGSGCASVFYKVRRMARGFKTFNSKEDAKIAHLNQSELAEHNLAPYVYSDVCRVRHANGKLTKWGFMTEMAETIKRDLDNYYEQEEMYSEEIESLVNECEDKGFSFGDHHLGNVGYVVRDGCKMMVVIDTGDESIVNEDRCYCVSCRKGKPCYA
jgi:hypothetical protein